MRFEASALALGAGLLIIGGMIWVVLEDGRGRGASALYSAREAPPAAFSRNSMRNIDASFCS